MKRLKAFTKRVTSSSHEKKESSSSSPHSPSSPTTRKSGSSSSLPASSQVVPSSGSKRFSITSHKEIQVIRGGYNIDLSHVDASFSRLHRSCLLNESEDKIQKCLSSAIDPNQVDHVCGSSPIHIAVVNNNLSTIRLLLKHGADINLPDGEGKTPLIKAIQCNHDQLVKFLIYNQANGNHADSESGNSALLWALNTGMMEGIKILLLPSSNIDVNRRNIQRETALHIISKNAALLPFLDQVMDMNATLNVIDVNGRTPLMNAAACGNLLAVQSLMRRGVDANVRDAAGHTAKDLAKSNGYQEIAQLIEGEGMNQKGKLSPNFKQPILMSWTDSEDSDSDADHDARLRPKSGKPVNQDRRSVGSFNPVIQQLQLLQSTTGESNVQPSHVRRSLGDISNISTSSPAEEKIMSKINNQNLSSSPNQEENQAAAAGAGRKISIDWASLMKTGGRDEGDPLLVSDSDDEEDDEEGDDEEEENDQINQATVKRKQASSLGNQDFIQNLRDLLEEEMDDSHHELDHLLQLNDPPVNETAGKRTTATTAAVPKERDQESPFSPNNPFNPFTMTNNSNDDIMTGSKTGAKNNERQENLVATKNSNHSITNESPFLDNKITKREEKGEERSNDHDAGTEDDGRGRKSPDAEKEVEKEEEGGGTTKSINQHLGSSSTRKEEKTAFTSVEKQDLNEVTSSLIQSENRLQETGGKQTTSDQQQDQEKKSSAAGAKASTASAAAVKAPCISKAPASLGSGGRHQQLPPVKSLIHSAPVIINLNPVSFIKSWREEEKDHDEAEIERTGNQEQDDHNDANKEQTVHLEKQQQLRQQQPLQTTRQSQADQQAGPQTSSSSDHNSDLHFNDHDLRRILPACYTDDENVDEEEEDEWHEMQSHEDLNFDHPPLALIRSASSPHDLQERMQQQTARNKSSNSLNTKEDVLVNSLSSRGSGSKKESSVTPAASSVIMSPAIDATTRASASSPTSSSMKPSSLLLHPTTTRESFDLNVRVKELESLYSKTKEELDKIKSTSHEFSQDYHSLLREKITMEESYYNLQTAYAKLNFESERLKSEMQRVTLDHELMKIKDQEIASLRAEREELFNEQLLLHQQMSSIRDEMSSSMKSKADSMSAESEKRLSVILSENANLVHENKELKHRLLILQAEMIRVKMDHETDVTLMQKEKERLILEVDAYRLRTGNNNHVNGKQQQQQQELVNSELIKSIQDLNSMISMMQSQQQQQFNDTIAIMKSNHSPMTPANNMSPAPSDQNDLDLLLVQTRDFLSNMSKELSGMKSILKPSKEGKVMDGKIKSLRSRIEEMENRINNSRKNELIYPALLAKFPIDKSPRSLFVRTLMQMTSGQLQNQQQQQHAIIPSPQVSIINPAFNMGNNSNSSSNNMSGNNFQSMKGNLEKEISQLKNQLGIFCSSISNPAQ